MQIYDITVPIGPPLAGWPGDTPFELTWNLRKCHGESVNLGTVLMSVHTGTHADAPFHFMDEGATIDQCELDAYCGPSVVIDVRDQPVIRRKHVPEAVLEQAPRVLFRTDAWKDYRTFPECVPVMEPELPDYLKSHGVKLIAVDVPSVDALDSKDLPNHHALTCAGISILEAVDLRDIEPGRYELIALPLRLLSADGAPVRAILRR